MRVLADTSADLGRWILTGWVDHAVVVRLYTLQPVGTLLSNVEGGVEERGRVYAPVDLRQYASFDGELKESADTTSGVTLGSAVTLAEPYNEVTFTLSAADAATVQGWTSDRGIGTVHGVDLQGGRTALGRLRWEVRYPSASRS